MKIRVSPCEHQAAYRVWLYRDDSKKITFMDKVDNWSPGGNSDEYSILPEPSFVIRFSDMHELLDQITDPNDRGICDGIKDKLMKPHATEQIKQLIKDTVADLLKHL